MADQTGTVYGNVIDNTWRVGVRYTYTESSSDPTSNTLDVGLSLCAPSSGDSPGTGQNDYYVYKEYVVVDGTDVAPAVNTSTHRYVESNAIPISSPKGAKTITVECSVYQAGVTDLSGKTVAAGTSKASFTITVRSLASWQVTYNANGGTGAPSAQTKWYNETLLLSKTAPTRADTTANRVVTFNSHGTTAWPVTNCPASLTSVATTKYSFSKWQKTGASTYYYPNTTYSDNAALSLTAVWSSSTTVTSIDLPSPTRTGYNFNGWYTAASGGTRVGGAGASYTPSGSTTLHAQWTEKTYTIKFDGNGGTGVPADQTKRHTTALTIPSTPTPTRTNYVFKNWNTIKAGTGTSFNAGGNYTLNGNATLYAQYYEPYIISYGANGGTNAPANTVKPYNTKVKLTTAKPTYGGMEFLGWNTNTSSTGTHYNSGAEIAANANANLSLYAVWRGVSVDVITPKRNGTTVSFTADWTLKGSVAGSGSIIAKYAIDESTTWNSITLSGTTSLNKTAGNPTTGSVSGTFTLPAANSCRIQLTATFNDSYGETSSTSTHTITATRTTTVGKPFKLFSAMHGGRGLAIGTIASLVDTFEVAWKAIFGGTVTSRNNEIDPSSASGSDTYVNGFRFVDSNDTFLGAVQIGQDANNNLYSGLFTSRKVNGTDVGNRILARVGSDGSRSYFVTDEQAFREAINAVQCGNAASMKAALDSLSGSAQWWSLYAWCINSANTNKNGHQVGLLVEDTTIKGYDWDDSGTKTQWTAYTTANKPTPADIGAQPAGNYVTRNLDNAWINTSGGSDQLWNVGGRVKNTSNTTYSDKDMSLIVRNTNIALYNGTNSAWIWTAYTTANKPTPADIGAQPAGNYATNGGAAMNGRFSTLGTGNQLWCLVATCVNSNNTTYYNKQQLVGFTNTNMFLYDSAGSSTIWTAYTTANKPTPAAIGAASTNTSGAINVDSYSTPARLFYINGKAGGSETVSFKGDSVSLYVKATGLQVYNHTRAKTHVNIPGYIQIYANDSGTTGSFTTSTTYIAGESNTSSAGNLSSGDVLGFIICYRDNDSAYNSTFVPQVGYNGLFALSVIHSPAANGKTFIKNRTMYISGLSNSSTFSNKYYGETNISTAGAITQASSNHIYVTRVIAVYRGDT